MKIATKRHFIVGVGLAVGLGVVVLPQGSPSFATTPEANTVAAQVDAVAVTDPNSPKLAVTPTTGSITAQGDGLTISMPPGNTGQVTLDSPGSADLTVGLPQSLAVTSPSIASDNATVVYGQQSANTAVALQAFGDGVKVHTVISNSSAPTSFVYPVDVPTGGSLQAAMGGAIAVLDSAGDPVGYLGTPWARDANNAPVATSFSIVGSTVVQNVAHNVAGVAYPVVADPYLFKDLIKSAKWSSPHRNAGDPKVYWTLEVTPTGWARLNAGGWLPGYYGWRELYGKYKNKGLNVNLGGMEDQYICHQQVVAIRDPKKPTWNLDEWRRDTTYAKTIAAQCNPAPPA